PFPLSPVSEKGQSMDFCFTFLVHCSPLTKVSGRESCLPALMTVGRSSVRGNKEEHAMPALETKETQTPRSALRHRPLREASTSSPAPLYRRASRVQGSVET